MLDMLFLSIYDASIGIILPSFYDYCVSSCIFEEN